MNIENRKAFRLLGLMAGLLVMLLYSAVVGTKTVRANSACTSAQCTYAQTVAYDICAERHTEVIAFACGVDTGQDDFFFRCSDESYEKLDCSTLQPS